MTITIKFGRQIGTTEPNGTMRIDPQIWLREKGGVRDFRKILTYCRESDTFFGTQTISEWTEALEAVPATVRESAEETAKEYNRHCEHIRTHYDDPSLPVEAKREDLKQMRLELREQKGQFDRRMKQLAKALEQSKVLLEEVRKAC